MTARIPVLPRGVRRHFDRVRGRNVLLGPERALMLDETGHAILTEIDGARSIDEIARDLAARYNAPADAIAADIVEFLSDLADKRLMDYADA